MGDTHNTQKKTYIMALDQGTTSSRCILFDKQGNICSMAQKEFTQIYPQPGWVEHNPMEIWSSQLGVAIESMAVLGITDDQIEAIGITNQRETTIIWDKNTGEPVYNAIVWQCRRTSDMIEELKKASGVEIPNAIEEIRNAQILHTRECDADKMKDTVIEILKTEV